MWVDYVVVWNVWCGVEIEWFEFGLVFDDCCVFCVSFFVEFDVVMFCCVVFDDWYDVGYLFWIYDGDFGGWLDEGEFGVEGVFIYVVVVGVVGSVDDDW